MLDDPDYRGIALAQRPARRAFSPGPGRSGRTTPRDTQLGSREAYENRFRASLRPDVHKPVRRPRSAGPPPRPSHTTYYSDPDWRASSQRYADATFHSSLRQWDGRHDVRHSTPADWRVQGGGPSQDGIGASAGPNGHGADDLSLNDADGWKRSASLWVEKQFRGGLRDYGGRDVKFNEDGTPKKQTVLSKDGKNIGGTNLGVRAPRGQDSTPHPGLNCKLNVPSSPSLWSLSLSFFLSLSLSLSLCVCVCGGGRTSIEAPPRALGACSAGLPSRMTSS